MTDTRRNVRDFVFRGLLFESEAGVFRRAGINVGIDLGEAEEQLLLSALAPFGVQRRNDALEMARLYAVLHAFENEVRSLLRDTLDEKLESNWWDTNAVPSGVKKMAESRQKTAEKDSWLEGAKADRLEFVDFGDLASIILQNWEHFKDLMPSQDWIKQRMTELEKARNFVAHNRMLLPSEFQRIYMYISDWNKVIGL
ncbi:Swt1 family HEPN domain-containing protein [Phyllobacterium sp. LjRoot231]|uniref:Swt1 family HEPN domain-containing protein n=1 Tax=Phyllobacterium sp. LjRoot231 TaxID=3342289 RepID=UPI003ECE4C78